ncbi:CBL-interacting protein kinase 23 [Diplonema papillatum]|nr:CBL-interacting protein kinase 23 [Diplonema papillatum]
MPKRIGEPGKGFVLGQTLGSGSFGEIKLARDEATGDAVAVKICSKHLVSKGKMRPMLQREIANMKSLSHPNVLKLICVLESTKQFYLAIELATGGELFDLIADKTRFSEETARSYFQQLLLGIDYCHKRGIVHRDLKPQNLLVTHENVLKIADFGFSNFQGYTEDGKVTPALRLRTCCGTPSYAAPEIFLGKGYNGFLTDVWSCGIILYVMLIGTVPFKPRGPDQGLQGVITAIMKGVFVLPKALSEDAKDLIRKILIVDPRRRAAIDGIFAHPWFAVDFDPASRSAAASETVSEDDVRRSIMSTNDEEEANSLAATLRSTMQAPSGPASRFRCRRRPARKQCEPGVHTVFCVSTTVFAGVYWMFTLFLRVSRWICGFGTLGFTLDWREAHWMYPHPSLCPHS